MSSKINQFLRKTAFFLMSFGIDPRKILSVINYKKYRRDYQKFKMLGGSITHRHLVLDDFGEKAGSARGHYFHQDLLVATLIRKANPTRHIDIGSRIDGFVAHVASFRLIEVFDVRDLNDTGHKNIRFTKADLMCDDEVHHELTDSLSCLHVIEHFGLGRYGDAIDPMGHIKGFNNMIKMLKPGGTLYISFPIGVQNEVHFNAHRVFHPTDIFGWAFDIGALRLERFDFVDDSGDLHQNVDIRTKEVDVKYGCGIYTFSRVP